jgi:catechol 2,3-dioxygenase-like lactoylglutathione lyase family enzyme
MTPQLNHTIVHVRDSRATSRFMCDLLGLDEPTTFGPFQVVELGNGASLDYMDYDGEQLVAHYAFLVTEDEFDEIFGRIRERDMPYWADPHQTEPGEINRHDGGRGVYFEDLDGHILEIITRPYGSGG